MPIASLCRLNLQVHAVNAVIVEELFVLLQSKDPASWPAESRDSEMSIFQIEKKNRFYRLNKFSIIEPNKRKFRK